MLGHKWTYASYSSCTVLSTRMLRGPVMFNHITKRGNNNACRYRAILIDFIFENYTPE